MSSPLLQVVNLQTSFGHDEQTEFAVDDVSFSINRGETFALLGESGSGKSITALSIMRLLPAAARINQGNIFLDDKDLLALPEFAMRDIRGRRIAMIFQEPQTSLNPVLSVGQQIGETLQRHKNLRGVKQRRRSIELLESVGIPEAERRISEYPHQFSGGMKQRIMIAIALAGEPDLLIADEPTTALDVTIQAQVLDLLRQIQKDTGMAILFITHDLAVASEMADDVAVMRYGKIVEQNSRDSFYAHPVHPYSQELFAALPSKAKRDSEAQSRHTTVKDTDSHLLLKVRDLKVHFPIKKGLLKKTDGQELTQLKGKALRQKRSDIQIVFQDPYSSMNPRMMIADVIAEGMVAQGIGGSKQQRLKRVDELLEQVGLEPNHKSRYPHEFSGGQRQRICIARALAVEPKLIVCDEPTSALDVSVQAQILDLLKDLQRNMGLSYLFITHNISVVEYLAHYVAVMYQGKIVEQGTVDEVLTNPQDPYTQKLLAAVPRLKTGT